MNYVEPLSSSPEMNTYEITFHKGDDKQRTVRVKDMTLLLAEKQFFQMYTAANTTIMRTKKIYIKARALPADWLDDVKEVGE